MPDLVHEDEPAYVISVAARLVHMHPQTLRYYERAGLINPNRSRGRIRLYSQRDIDRLRKIARLTDDLGVNLAGVEVILRLTESLEQARRELEKNGVQIESDYTVAEEAPAAESPSGRRLQPTSRVARSRPAAQAKSRRTK